MYVLINDKDIWTTISSELRGPDIGSDHNLMKLNFKVKLRVKTGNMRKEKWDKHTTHKNPTVTGHASFIPPHPPTYPERPITRCLPSPLVRPALVRTSVRGIK